MAYLVSLAHPAADAFPWSIDEDKDDGSFAALVGDMRRNGFDESRPIIRDRRTGRIIDGRRRELAARIAGVEPIYLDVDWSEEEIIACAQRDGLQRRSLNPSQRSTAVAELSKLLAQGQRKGESCNVATLDEIAEQAGVSKRTAADATKVVKKAPELAALVKEGGLPVHTAAKLADLPAEERQTVLTAPEPKKAAKVAIRNKATKQGAKKAKKPGRKTAPGATPVEDCLRDSLGNPVPACVADTFADPTLADAVARINAAHAELVSIERHVKTTLERKSEFWPYAQNGECATSLLAAADHVARASAQLANGLPYCVCPRCNGKACKHCRDGGYWSRHRYDERHQYGE